MDQSLQTQKSPKEKSWNNRENKNAAVSSKKIKSVIKKSLALGEP